MLDPLYLSINMSSLDENIQPLDFSDGCSEDNTQLYSSPEKTSSTVYESQNLNGLIYFSVTVALVS